ncbi:STAM-binding protein [Copidosoma floridanum]|uniref:STAM-binding protein n=1 Tax=Copidosoma floridanum TaxID=29053 RepID=UPI000C6FAAA7|nr:STAM-binding protein [Copidosoma floridanum]
MEKDREKMESRRQNDVRLMSPEKRLETCFDSARKFHFELNNSITRYIRSGKELIRQADVYLKEGDLEKAFILYIRYITIFVEKIENHPEYNTIPPNDREQIRNTLRDLFPKTELLKEKVKKQFQIEHIQCKKEIEELDRIEAERLKQKERQRVKEEEDRKLQPYFPELKTPQIGIMAGAVTTSEDNYKSKRLLLPANACITPYYEEQQAQSSRDRKVPTVDRSTKPSSLPCDRLREIVIPSKIMENFLTLAYSNTLHNIETCGILAGKLEHNKLFVTHLLIPKQSGSPDSCITTNEEDIFDYQDQHNLITLGWIHTHPTQTAFLSSVDLHTHCSYQLMMAEAIAIVCAPKYDKTGFFHLTPDYGLNYIANCRETGFHPHSADPLLYTVIFQIRLIFLQTAKHYRLDFNAPIQAIDLRRK